MSNSLAELHVSMNVNPTTNETSFSVGLGENDIRTFATKKEALNELREILQKLKDKH